MKAIILQVNKRNTVPQIAANLKQADEASQVFIDAVAFKVLRIEKFDFLR